MLKRLRFTVLLPGLIFAFISSQVAAAQMEDYTGPLFPSNHALNAPIDTLPVHPRSAAYIASIGASTHLHPDFGTSYLGRPIGIPYNLVTSTRPLIPITFDYADESDAGPYPIPSQPLIEGLNLWSDTQTGDRHLLIINTGTNRLYETWNTWPNPGNTAWQAGSGAVFDLSSNTLRPNGWTSADAAGLPIFPCLVRYDEVARGAIAHAIRFTASRTQNAYVWPARHYASSITDLNVPPLGQRFRLKSSFNITGFSPRMQVILTALKKYGFILADNGSNWYFTGTHDDRWDDSELNTLKSLQGSDFEAVDISGWLNHPAFNLNSAAVPGIAPGSAATPTVSPNKQDKTLVYPQPALARDPVIRLFMGPIQTLKIDIYNIAGERVHTCQKAVSPVAGANNQFYYDYVWTGEKAAGVYLAIANGSDGKQTITRKVKFAVGK